MTTLSGLRWNGSPKNSDAIPSIGESRLKAKEDQLLAREAAMAEYASARRAVDDNMARLKALRLARDSARLIMPAKPVKAVLAKKRKRRNGSVPTVT